MTLHERTEADSGKKNATIAKNTEVFLACAATRLLVFSEVETSHAKTPCTRPRRHTKKKNPLQA